MIKILSKKQWINIESEISHFRSLLDNLRKSNTGLLNKLSIEEYKNSNLMHTIENLQEDKRKLASAKGGLNAKIKRLENKIKHLEELQIKMDEQYKELEEKYKESMTDKYLVKKLKPGRTPKTTSMKLKDCSRVSNITRKVISHYEKDM